MILELAVLDVIAGQGAEFEASFAKAASIISSMPGYISHELKCCLEVPNRYLLLVSRETLEDHTRVQTSTRIPAMAGSAASFL